MCESLKRSIPGLVGWLLLSGLLHAAFAQNAVTLIDNGDPANRVDIAILGDGYTAGEMQLYANDVGRMVQNMFLQEPFREYQTYFNVHRIDVVSSESGVDHPERTPPSFRNTAFDASYNCSDIQRLVCVTESKVLTAASNALSPAQRDAIIVIVNDTEFGGSGGILAVSANHTFLVESVLHELGHSFGLLGDEYGGPPPPACITDFEPQEPNITLENRRDLIKWAAWIDSATPTPTGTSSSGIPGSYQGAQYCDAGKYRPTFNSKMRTLNLPFEQINTEQLIKRIYSWVSPIDSSSPDSTSITVPQGDTQLFSVAPTRPASHELTVNWFVDGQPQGSGTAFTFDAAASGEGLHTVEAVVSDTTASVRNDAEGVLTERRTWNVTVGEPSTSAPFIRFLAPASTPKGTSEFTLTVTGSNFLDGSVVRWNGSARATTFVNDTTLRATILAGDVASGGTFTVTVFNSEPEAASSNGVGFGVQDFSLAVNPTSATVSAGQTAVPTVTISPIGGHNQAVSLSCTGGPPGSNCTVTPRSVSMDGTNPATATVRVVTSPPAITLSHGLPLFAPMFLLLSLVYRKKAARTAGYIGAIIAIVILAGACGGSRRQPEPLPGGHTITITATSGPLTQTTTMLLRVQ